MRKPVSKSDSLSLLPRRVEEGRDFLLHFFSLDLPSLHPSPRGSWANATLAARKKITRRCGPFSWQLAAVTDGQRAPATASSLEKPKLLSGRVRPRGGGGKATVGGAREGEEKRMATPVFMRKKIKETSKSVEKGGGSSGE